jgi:hypothetical protein
VAGEPRPLPFLKDVLLEGLNAAEDGDIIFFTNDDNWLHPSLPAMLRYHIGVFECGCSQRCEFKNAPMPPPTRPASEFTHGSRSHMGRDLFAFTKQWLQTHWDEIPDFILGCSEWDLCVAAIIRNHFGITTTRRNLEQVIHPAEIPLGYVSHVWHSPHWARAAYMNSSPGQLWNRKLFQDWAKDHAPHLRFDDNLCI